MNIHKRILCLVLPKPILKYLQKLNRMQKTLKLIDLSRINLIREKNLEYLSSADLLETDLLLKLGLNNEVLNEFPEELHTHCGHGLFSWQYPNQFSKYLTHLSKYKINSYLEIGTKHGGTFVITVEYLEKFHPLSYAVGIDISKCPSLLKYKSINPKAEFFKFDSQSAKFKKFLEKYNVLDLVLIDGCHEMEVCMNDFEIVKEKANICVFHDIVSDLCPGVVKVWNQIKNLYPNDYKFYEFIEQYDSVKKRTGQKHMGIGIAIKNTFCKAIISY
jgi:cephalosporin hydroxylase